jgi:SAM-dependent methyltransferase
MNALDRYYPHWRGLRVHESSPLRRGASKRLASECKGYVPSQFFPDTPPGASRGGVRCENLEQLTFDDESFDLHITQDVMEHVARPLVAFREIARTLRKGGAHVFTVPVVRGMQPSRMRIALRDDGEYDYLEEPQYHGNPVGNGALVTVDWGRDICAHIFEACGLFTHVFAVDDLSKGIRAPRTEVYITVKPRGGWPEACGLL